MAAAPALVRLRIDYDASSKEYGLPDTGEEREEEEEDGPESKAVLGAPGISRLMVSLRGVAHSYRRITSSGPVARSPVLRC